MDVYVLLCTLVCTVQVVQGLICYDCGKDIITKASQCQLTKACGDGEQCMLKTLTSTLDGHTEYGMKCAGVLECDGIPSTPEPPIVGKRGIHSRSLTYNCCSTNLCNVPITVNNLTCNRDIEIMLEDSLNVTKLDYQEMVAFLKSMVSHLDIGPLSNQVGLSTYDSNIDHKWDLDEYDSLAALQAAFERLSFSHHIRNSADIHRVVDYIVDHALKHRNGDRQLFPDTVVIFIDQMTHVRLRDLIVAEKHSLENVSRDVIIVVVGPNPDSGEITQLFDLASSSGHVLHVSSYSNLMSIQAQLLTLLCK